jgi:hypothetical protein
LQAVITTSATSPHMTLPGWTQKRQCSWIDDKLTTDHAEYKTSQIRWLFAKLTLKLADQKMSYPYWRRSVIGVRLSSRLRWHG